MFNLTTQSISISRDITWLNVKYGKWKSRINNAHDPSQQKEQLQDNHHGYYNLYHHSNEEINHPNYEPEEIITETNHQLEINHDNTQDVQP